MVLATAAASGADRTRPVDVAPALRTRGPLSSCASDPAAPRIRRRRARRLEPVPPHSRPSGPSQTVGDDGRAAVYTGSGRKPAVTVLPPERSRREQPFRSPRSRKGGVRNREASSGGGLACTTLAPAQDQGRNATAALSQARESATALIGLSCCGLRPGATSRFREPAGGAH